ncbi:hypothetical protein V1291_000028 [Nitrobacteraceae bacterium AZCC 1564]
MSHWWRAEDTSIDHPKLLKLSDAMFRAWYTLNCVASANDGVLPSTEDVAVRLRMKPAKVAEWITKLVAAGLYDNDNGVFRPHNWGKRQYKTDKSDPTNAERQQRYRDRHRNERNTVTHNGSNGVTVKRPEAEQITDTEQSRADAAPPPIDEDLKKRAFALATSLAVLFKARDWAVPPGDRSVHWLQQGYAQGTVFRSVENVLKRGKPISSWEYFDGAIRDEHAKPTSVPVGAASDKVVDLSAINWDSAVKLWKMSSSIWPRGVGGEPGTYSCKCPANVIADNLIDPATGRHVSAPLVFVPQGTEEMAAWCQDSQVKGRKPPTVFEFEEDGIVKAGSFMPSLVPAGYDPTRQCFSDQSENAA